MVHVESVKRGAFFRAFETAHDSVDGMGPGMRDRADNMAAVRKAITDGRYETPEKIEIVVRRLLEELRPTS